MGDFWKFTKNEESNEIELRVDGEIKDNENVWIYEWLGIPVASPNRFRNELARHKGRDITVWIDSYGGSYFAGIGIYNALTNHDGKVTTITDGKAMSSGNIIAMAGDVRKITLGGMMMAHNPGLDNVGGYASDFRKYADYLDEVKESIMNIYEAKTGKSREEIFDIMETETFMSAQTAVNHGFADEIWHGNDKLLDVTNHFDFRLLDVQNSAKNSMKKFFEIANENSLIQVTQKEEPVQNKNEEGDVSKMEINTVEDLKNEYPELVKQVENAAREDGKTEERTRIQNIEKIAKNIDSDLVNKAKFKEPMNAKDLAFEAMQNEQNKAQNYMENVKEDFEGSGAEDVNLNPVPENEDKPKTVDNLVNEAAALFDRKRRGEK